MSKKKEIKKISDDKIRSRLNFTDEQLLKECEIHTYRASGPGGQKKNKTSSAVRLHHRPTGIIIRAVESRSQYENKSKAIKRLRTAIAIKFRFPLPDEFKWPARINIIDTVCR